MIERFFRDLSSQRIRRGVFRSVPGLIMAIESYIADHNQHPKPFVWTAKASDILEKVKRSHAVLHKLQSACRTTLVLWRPGWPSTMNWRALFGTGKVWKGQR
jgi:hypothetical protein